MVPTTRRTSTGRGLNVAAQSTDTLQSVAPVRRPEKLAVEAHEIPGLWKRDVPEVGGRRKIT